MLSDDARTDAAEAPKKAQRIQSALTNMSNQSLVTGAAGFIGSHVARELIGMGHSVIALDDLSGGFEDNLPSGAEFVRGSVEDFALVNRLFSQHQFDYVFHLAAYAAEGLSHF